MAVATLTSILPEILKCRLEDVPKLVKMLENLTQNLKQQSCMTEFYDGDESRAMIVRWSVQSYYHALGFAKLLQALDKALRCLPSSFTTCFILEMRVVLQQLLVSSSLADLRTLSSLLDQRIAKEMISQNLFGSFSTLLQNVLETSHAEDDYRLVSIKLCIQVLQLFPQEVKSVFNKHSEHSEKSDGGQVFWQRIIAALLVSFVQSSSQDIVLLTGTALAMTFSYAPNPDMTQTACQSVLSLLSCGQTCMNFAGMDFDLKKLVPKFPDDVSLPVAGIIKGILVCCNKEALSCGHKPLLTQVLPGILQLCQGLNIHHYLAFQLLELWYQKLDFVGALSARSFVLTVPQGGHETAIIQTKMLKVSDVPDSCIPNNRKTDISCHPSFMTRGCDILNSTLACIWSNWDSPVEGVTELVVKIHDHLLKMWHEAVKEGVSDYDDLCEQLMSCTLSLAWHSKARYRSLTGLLTYVNSVQFLQTNEQLRADVMRCMRTNHLATVACDVYKASLQQIINYHSQTEALGVWTDLWMPTLLAGLTSSDSLQSLKTRTYWLPPSLKLIAGSSEVLLNFIEEHLSSAEGLPRQRWLFAWISVSALVRELLRTPNNCLESSFLKESLLCAEDEIRMEALKCLCTSVKRGEPMSDVEVRLLQEFIPANLKTDSTAFRQNMTSAVKKMLVRIRDSCLNAVRNNRTEEPFLARGLQFIEWLYHLLMQSLFPGGSYQRIQSSLDLLTAVLEALVYQPESFARKGQAQESCDILLMYAQGLNKWKFFSENHYLTLVYGLEDGAVQIQTQCYHLLVKYFTCDISSCNNRDNLSKTRTSTCTQSVVPTSVLTSLLSSDRICAELFQRALYQISCPRAYENHSGMLMMSLVLNRHLIDWSCSTSSCELSETMTNSSCCVVQKRGVCEAANAVLNILIDRLKASLEAVLENLGENFHTHSLHGLTQTVARCLLEMRKVLENLDIEGWRSRLEEIVSLNQKIINFVLEVLAGRQSFECCPSFAEMGIALNSLISVDQEQEESVWSMSPEFQLLLSWCWLNLKEGCSCLGMVTSVAVTSGQTCPLPTSVVLDIGQTFVKVLTTCRHRGAIEGSRQGLYHFCSSLMSSGNAVFNEIPGTILKQMLVSVSQNSLASSVTRRSAGLPIFIQTVIQAAPKSGKKNLLLSTVEQLYEVASQQLPTDHSDLQDLNQSQALHILKTIFCDASLSTHLLTVLSKMTILVIEGFDSPSWAIRNAATQLISTLVTRIFGQKNPDNTNWSMSLEDFSIQFPQLVQFVCEKMRAYVASKVTVKPSLYIVLTLLSELGMSPLQHHSSSNRCFLSESVLSFISSPVFSLRKLSAQAYVALSPLDMADTTLRNILQKIQQQDLKLNELHGWLLSTICLLSSGTVSQEMCISLLVFVVENKWLLFKFPLCFLPMSTLMQVIHLALARSTPDLPLFESLWELVEACILSLSATEGMLQIDRDQCLRQCLQTLVEIHRASDDTTGTFRLRLCQFLQNNITSQHCHLREAIKDCLQTGADFVIADPGIQRAILVSMRQETNMAKFLQSADLLMKLALKGDLRLQSSDLLTLDLTTKKSQWEKFQNFELTSFIMGTILIGYSSSSENESRYQKLLEWSDQLLVNATPTLNEDCRIYAAKSLAIAGENVLNFCSINKSLPDIDRLLSSVIKASLRLLEDTESEVRQLVSCFISKTQGIASLTSSWCYQALSRLICEKYYWSSGIVSTLLELLHTPGRLTTAISCALSSRQQVLFEPETTSAMSETFITQIWSHNTLQEILATYPGNHTFQQQLHSAINCVLEELSSNMAVIKDNLYAFPVFNISCDDNVLSSLLGIILLSCLHLSNKGEIIPLDNEDVGEADRICLQDLVQSLLQIPFLHPFLGSSQLKDLPACVSGLLHKQLPLLK